MPARYRPHGSRYGKTHCPRQGTMVEVDPTKKGNLSSRAIVLGPAARAGHVLVQFRFNVGPTPYEVPCDRLTKAPSRRGSTFLPHPTGGRPVQRLTFEGARRRRKRRR